MDIHFLKSYDRSFRKLERPIQEKTILAVDSLLDFFYTRQKPEGLGLKKVYKNYWEIRIDIRYRIIFEFYGGGINIVFVGDHKEIKQFLRHG